MVFSGEIMPDSDASLLQSFAAHRGEKAFRALADRYLGLIYHTAVRRTGNRTLSEEISQNVLCALAKKAGSLAAHPERLAAWLHRATLYESLKAMRSEAAHQRRKELHHPDEIHGHPGESPWSDALPVLDDSLGKLSESDRTVLLLHFYENQSFPRISRTLGRSTEAVQKQSRRALEKLARLLRGKGIALSVTGIATGLSAEFAKAAPAYLSTTYSAAALSALAETQTSLLTVLTMKPKVLIPATLIVCAIPLAFQQQAISSANTRHTELLAKHSENPDSSAFSSRQTVTNTRLRLPADFKTIRDAWDEIVRAEASRSSTFGSKPRAEAYATALEAFDDKTLIRLSHEGSAQSDYGKRRDAALLTIIWTLAKRDPRLALDTSLAAQRTELLSSTSERSACLGSVLGHWAGTDPQAAYTWFLENHAKGNLEKLSEPLGSNRGDLSDLTMPFLDSLILSSPSLAREMISSFPDEQRVRTVEMLPSRGRLVNRGLRFETLGDVDPPPASNLQDYSLNMLGLIREFAPQAIEKQMQFLLLMFSKDQTEEFLEKAQLNENEKLAAARHFVQSTQTRRIHPDGSASGEVVEWKAEFAERLAPGLYESLLADIRQEQTRQKSMIAEMQLRMIRQNPASNDTFLSEILTNNDFSTHREAALEQANRIQDPEKRRKVIEKLQKNP